MMSDDALVENSAETFISESRSWILQSISERCFPMERAVTRSAMGAKTLSEEERYVNIAGGPRDSGAIRQAEQWCERYGMGSFMDVVKGPLLRATARGRVWQVTHMPLKPGSTYAHVAKALLRAWEINQERGVVDSELDLEGLDKPKFGNHGNRRHADKRASDSKEETGVTSGQIDDHFGWDQKQRRKISQLHYHGRVQRLQRARVTMML